ncbi:ATP-grasp domain-containing protein [Xenorhabdus miraniensis]|uniref:Carbamoyl-phosphate synthase small chain n=1 Tax=Xenorhabdus miraniensis TaxID=351674 RepID=A0A2D0JQP6_9GAMM|nr:ATP-grasp domain-containing protein [Xenorhabdus miraniensis]PHM48647.1 Carbamoyl-phosphate synthase small chain [Xenorhabdus miraniensis]PHM48980.1 Carbamoyl-phosphate synthase small chain [Xenorhabdus miraniensis]
MKEYVALVDVYSSGNFLPRFFKENGISLIHVQSTPELMPTMLGPNLSEYEINLVYNGCNLDEIVILLKEMNVIAIIAGQEPGVILADLLSESLHLTNSNGTQLSSSRRNKYDMIETLHQNNINATCQIKSAEKNHILDWVNNQSGYPCVVKPLSSASTDGVTICFNEKDVIDACDVVLNNKDIFGLDNKDILVQSFLEGDEYIVDTVSSHGHVYICGIWKYVKKMVHGGKNIYDRDVLIDENSDEAKLLVDYIYKVLPALGIMNGPAHAEVILTDKGPALVEIGARLNGNMEPDFHDIVLGNNQARITYIAYCSPDRFLKNFAGKKYRKLKEACVLNTSTKQDGIITAINESIVNEIRGLDTVFKLVVKYSVGRKISPTIDLLSSPLRIFIFSDEKTAIELDYKKIDSIKDGVYELNV